MAFYALSTKDTVPSSTSITATSTDTQGIYVAGTGTSFLSEVQRGDYFVDLANDEVRKIVAVKSDTSLEIESPFTADSTIASPVIVENPKNIYIEVENTGGSATTINGVAFNNGAVETFGRPTTKGQRRFLTTPIVVDGATSTCKVNLTTFGE